MPFVNRIVARAFSQATEKLEQVQTAVLNVFPSALHGQVQMTVISTEGYGQIPIKIINAQIEGKKYAHLSFEHIIHSLSRNDLNLLSITIDQRLDDKCVFFLRLNKQDAYKGTLTLSSTPDIISVKVYLREFPRCTKQEAVVFLLDTIRKKGVQNGN